MKNKNSNSKSAFFYFRALTALALCVAGGTLAVVALKSSGSSPDQPAADERMRDMPTLGESPQNEHRDLERLEQFWNDRLTYPTGKFDPAWVRAAAAQHFRMQSAVPAGSFERLKNPAPISRLTTVAGPRKGTTSVMEMLMKPFPLALSTSGFTALGPSPEQMTGCTGCFNYVKTQARVNAIAADPTTPTSGSITAYVGSVGGGVWKTTNCCSASTTWTVLTDDPLIATIAIDTLTIDPNTHNTIYAGTGDLNYGSFSAGSQGILKSTDAAASWTLLGANVFGPGLTEPAGQFPQYDAVGKVRVDPNNSNNVVAGTKRGLYFSYDGGNNWTGPCTTNNFNTQRQDITGLELTNVSGTTRIIAAVGVRGFATPVQYNLNQNGANGIYKGTMPASGCPTDFTPITTNASGWTGTNATSGVPCNLPKGDRTSSCASNTNQLGRIDIAVAPSNPNYIYAQVQSINPNFGSTIG